MVTLNTTGSSFDTMLTVIRLTASGFVIQACNDDATGLGLASQVSFNPVVGTRYYIVAGGYNGAVGSLHLAISNGAGGGGHTPGPLPVAPPVNHAPTVAAPIADQGATADSLFTFVVPAGTFGDPDGDALTYAAVLADDSPIPAWLSFDPTTQTFTGTPAAGDVGTLSIKVSATDTGALSASDTFDLVVAAAPPTTGTITVVANQVPSTDPGLFDLLVDEPVRAGRRRQRRHLRPDHRRSGDQPPQRRRDRAHDRVAGQLRDLEHVHRGHADGTRTRRAR